MTQQFHFWEYIQRKEFGKEYLEKISATPMFIAALFTVAKVWKYPKCPSMDEWIKKLWYMYTMEYYSAIKKWVNPVIYNNMDGPWGHYVKWNKSDRERQILYDLSYMWCLKKPNKQTYKTS